MRMTWTTCCEYRGQYTWHVIAFSPSQLPGSERHSVHSFGCVTLSFAVGLSNEIFSAVEYMSKYNNQPT